MPVQKTHLAKTQVPGRIRISLEIDCPMGSTSSDYEVTHRFEKLVKDWTSKWGFVPDDEILEVLWEKAQDGN